MYPYPPQGSLNNSNSEGEGVTKPKFLKESMMLNWKFQEVGVGGQTKKPFMGCVCVDIFWNPTDNNYLRGAVAYL